MKEKNWQSFDSDNDGENGTEGMLDSLTNGLIKKPTDYEKGEAGKKMWTDDKTIDDYLEEKLNE